MVNLIFRSGSWSTAVLVVVIETIPGEATTVNWTLVLVALIGIVPLTYGSWSVNKNAKLAAKESALARKEAAEAKAEAASANQGMKSTKDQVVEARQQVTEIKLSIDGFMAKHMEKVEEAARIGGIADERAVNAETAAAAAVEVAVVAAGKADEATAAAEQRTPAQTVAVPGDATDTGRIADETKRVADETARVANAAEGSVKTGVPVVVAVVPDAPTPANEERKEPS